MAIQLAPFRSRRADDNGFAPRAGFEPFQVTDAEQSIVRRFSDVARRRGDAVAVVAGHEVITYRALLQRAADSGATLRDRLGMRTGPVVIRLPGGVAAIEALLGVLYSGRSYLFLPPRTGPDALDDLHTAAVPAAQIVADDELPAGAPATVHVPWSTFTIGKLRSSDRSAERTDSQAEPNDLACLFATSGTTGTPKLVGLSHRAVLFDVGRQINDLYLGADDRIDLLGHPSFSASLASIFTALLTGAELHILDTRHRFADLGAWLTQSRITVSTMTVSTLRALCATLPPGGAPPSLRLVSVGGEPLLAKDVAAFYAAFPSPCVLQNATASTETRTYAQYFVPRGTSQNGSVPIGWPVFAKDVEILGPDGAPVVGGQQGEIAVRSCYLAQGYVNSPSLTADRFLTQPDGSVRFLTGDRGCLRADGCLTFLGRVDSMVKVRGYRVEPGTVEAALLHDSRVRQAAVVARQSASCELYLVAYVVLEARTAANSDQLLGAVANRLPAYAVPSALVIVESLPITRNGKTDYQALTDREIVEPPSSTGSSGDGTTAALLQIWTEILGRSDLSADDSFFKCGGDSLNAIRLQLMIHRRFKVDLPLEVLVRYPSVNTLAEWLTHGRESNRDGAGLVLLNQGNNEIPLFCVPGIGGEPSGFGPLAARLGERPVYGLRTPNELHGLDLSIETLAAECLRAIDAVTTPSTPALLCGHSFGAIVAFEMAHQLKAAGRPLGLLAIIDMPLNAGHRRGWQHLRDILVNLPAWLRYDAFETDWTTLAVRSWGKLAVLGRQIRSAASRERAPRKPDLRAYFGKRNVPREMEELLTVRLNALARYRLRPIAEKIVLFRARAQALFGRSDRHLGWERLAAVVDVCDVPGHHESCAAEPHVRRLAELLSDRLGPLKRS